MSKRIFISIGFPEKSECLPALDRILMKDMLITIASYADTHGHTIILRDHPAVVPMMEALLSRVDALELVDEKPYSETGMEQPDLVFFIGGAEESLDDYHYLRENFPHIPLHPMRTTGGAAVEIDCDMELNGTLHPVLIAESRDAFGFYALRRLLDEIAPNAQPHAPKPPSPSF